MIRNGYFTAGDPKEDGDADGVHPGYWLNRNAQGVLVGLISKRDCKDANGRLVVDWPRAEERVIPCPSPSPTPPPPPGPTPTPRPGGGPALFQMGNSWLAPRDCGNCRREGYLGYVVNRTATPLCDGRNDDCVCFDEHGSRRNRCEIPKAQQDPRGADIWIRLPGVFGSGPGGYDICDARSENPYNCGHKPKVNETGRTEFRSCPKDSGPGDGRCVTRYVDVNPNGPVDVKVDQR
jgi:hypothetical protein